MIPRAKAWQERRLVTEHAFDKLRAIDCGLAEFFAACEAAEVIDEVDVDEGVKELILTVAWTRPCTWWLSWTPCDRRIGL